MMIVWIILIISITFFLTARKLEDDVAIVWILVIYLAISFLLVNLTNT
ncbi:hypothetical protein LP114_070 [Listeria phage LP-114]|uniref:Transmembrane protein n=1 Tax=Listeria phage LP-114 TaxID=1458857 RepID=A0A059T5C7_9CAUD|nr:hypothetical protein LP114_070 [Listeria phage LP-114]AHL18658.1 hypothetical protein LP114_070 [Listeria phage LP-114]